MNMPKSKTNQKHKTGWRCWHTFNPSTQEVKVEVSLLLLGQSDLHCELQASQGYIDRLCYRKTKITTEIGRLVKRLMGKVPAGKLCGLSSVLGFYMVEENYFPQVVI